MEITENITVKFNELLESGFAVKLLQEEPSYANTYINYAGHMLDNLTMAMAIATGDFSAVAAVRLAKMKQMAKLQILIPKDLAIKIGLIEL